LVPENTDSDDLLARLEAEARVVSRERARMHRRIEYARTMGDGAGNPHSPEQLAELDAEERELSATRRELHARTDQLPKEQGHGRPSD
jgi:hypothetical protein